MRLKEINPGMVIHCKTEEEAEVLLGHLQNQGIKWIGGISMEQTNWVRYKWDTCYAVGHDNQLQFSEKEYFEQLDLKITEFSDLIIPELSAAEVPAILYEICKEYSSGGVNCSPDCPFAFHGMKCDQYKAENGQRVVEACEQWKIDHEKKEPEFEWVDVCRIIEVQDNGKKVCVHEEDIKDADLPFGYKECTTEMILKEYMKNHSGNYFATVEHVCRVKK